MESPIKRDDNTSRTFEEIRQLIDPTLFTKICEAVHHDKSDILFFSFWKMAI